MDFMHGPFLFSSGRETLINSVSRRNWSMYYGSELLATHFVDSHASRDLIHEAFGEDRVDFTRSLRSAHAPERLDLIDYEIGEAVATLEVTRDPGLTPGLIDDRSRYWLRSKNKLHSLDVTLEQFAQIAQDYGVLENSWVAGTLPSDVMTTDAEQWRAPTAWELRHIVGEGSFTSVTGAQAATLVGVTPQNFRKYTARDGASTRQNMSYAMWHLLLHKLGVQRA